MLMLNSNLENTPVMSLQTGSQLATVGDPLINPANLQIVAYNLENNTYSNEKSLVRIAEIRELSRLGFIVDSGEDFISKYDVIKIKNIIDLDFHLIGIKVVDEKGNNLGKVIDFTINLVNFTVEQLIIRRPFLKSLNNPELTIHRNLITQIDNDKITVKESIEDVIISRNKSKDFKPNYINPFRD